VEFEVFEVVTRGKVLLCLLDVDDRRKSLNPFSLILVDQRRSDIVTADR
jgi:hypothetical protein